jgi:hypothetical protein
MNANLVKMGVFITLQFPLISPSLAHPPEETKREATGLSSGQVKTVSHVEARQRQKKRIAETVKRRKLSRGQVKTHNLELLGLLNINLPPRDFDWRYIVIHHTASEWSSLQRIDRYHRDKFEDPDGIEYHFLIANGRRQPRGLIELGRWPLQERSIHLFKPEGAPEAITISLVGNLHERKIYSEQYLALKQLTSALMTLYRVPLSRLTTHHKIDGNLTVCPGKHFPFKRLIRDLKRALKDTHPELIDLKSQ